MNEHPGRERLADYAEGLLAEEARGGMARHLAGCDACAREVAGLRDLLDELASLPDRISPERDLYAGIASRIAEGTDGPRISTDRRQAWRLLRWPIAAAALLLIVLTTTVNSLLIGRKAVTFEPVPGPAADPAGAYLAIEREYASAIDELARALEARRAELSAETLGIIEENLRLIDEALAESRAALENDPRHPTARALAVAALEQKLELLRSAIRIRGET